MAWPPVKSRKREQIFIGAKEINVRENKSKSMIVALPGTGYFGGGGKKFQAKT
jgi:hypothetical protein